MSNAEILLTPTEVVAELRLALIADIRSLAEDVLSIISDAEHGLLVGFLDGHGGPCRRRWQQAARDIQVRQQLHETIGWPGEPLSEITIAGDKYCALAVTVLTEYREAQVARLAHGTVPDSDREALSARVQVLNTYLRYARVAPRYGIIEIKDRRPFPAP